MIHQSVSVTDNLQTTSNACKQMNHLSQDYSSLNLPLQNENKKPTLLMTFPLFLENDFILSHLKMTTS